MTPERARAVLLAIWLGHSPLTPAEWRDSRSLAYARPDRTLLQIIEEIAR